MNAFNADKSCGRYQVKATSLTCQLIQNLITSNLDSIKEY